MFNVAQGGFTPIYIYKASKSSIALGKMTPEKKTNAQFRAPPPRSKKIGEFALKYALKDCNFVGKFSPSR